MNSLLKIFYKNLEGQVKIRVVQVTGNKRFIFCFVNC